MEHYFISKAHKESDYFTFSDTLLGNKLTFNSVDGVFNYHGVDEGTRTLIDTLVKCNIDIKGDVLDIGCGLGVIGISVARYYTNINLTMCDVNSTVVELATKNAELNSVKSNIVVSNTYDNINDKFDFVLTNPPIKAGKKVLFDIVLGAYDKLREGGKIILVIRKNLGMQSLKNNMVATYGNCEILNRNKGYYILCSTKK